MRTTMKLTNTNKLMPHRPSRGVTTRVASLAASSKVGKRKEATDDASLLDFSHIRSFPPPCPVDSNLSSGPSSMTDSTVPSSSSIVMPPPNQSPVFSDKLVPIFKPYCSVYFAAFNVRILKHTGQQAALARRL